MHNLQKVSQQTFWQILGKTVTAFSTFIILGIVARKYGPEGTGIFTLALTYLAIFYLLSDFGFNAHVLKQKEMNWQKLLGTRILWSGVLIIIAVGTLPFWPFAGDEFSKSVLIGSLAILASGIFITCNLIFQSKLRYDLSVLASSVGTLIGLGVFIYLSFQNLPIPYLLLGHVLGWIFIAGLAFFLVKIASSPSAPRNDEQIIFPIYDIRYTKTLFKDSWLIAGTLFLNVVYFRADSFMISIFRGNTEVGIYNIAYSIFQTALVLPTFIMNAYYPMLLKSFKEVRLIGLGLLILAGLGILLTYLLSPFFVGLLTGGGFNGSVESLTILSLGFPAFFLSSLLMWIMVSKGKYKSMFAIYLIGLIANISLNFMFIPTYSFIAASWITVISEYLILSLQVIIVTRHK